jgi:hypothetical protein
MAKLRSKATGFVLGAGASRDVGYPLAADMGTGLLDFMQNSEKPAIRKIDPNLLKSPHFL